MDLIEINIFFLTHHILQKYCPLSPITPKISVLILDKKEEKKSRVDTKNMIAATSTCCLFKTL